MTSDPAQLSKARDFLLGYRRADPKRLQFEERNLYDLVGENRAFDEIICYETLEHIRRDSDVLREFHRILRPGGYLHLCCPYSMHPRHRVEVLDEAERGGHVRRGYTEHDYRQLLEPLGFEIDRVVGIGPNMLYRADAILRAIRNRLGDLPALPIFPLMLTLVWFARENPPVPFSIYVRVVKRSSAATVRMSVHQCTTLGPCS